jgi:hypothetical protein
MQLTVDLPITLDDIAKSISEKATQKGLTEEKLRELLEEHADKLGLKLETL